MFRDFLSPSAVRASRFILLHVAACGSVLGLASGCIELEPGTDELPDPTQETQAEQPAAGRDWSCLRESNAPGVLVNSPIGASRLVRSLQITDLVSGTVPPNVFVRACGQPDVNCTTPLSGQIPIDAEGWVDLPLFEGFDGYLEITAETLVPTMLFYTDPLSIETQVDTTPVGVVTKSLLPGLSAQTGMVQEDNLGLVYLRVFDCKRDPAPGISFSVNQESAWRWYFVGKLPTSLVESTSDTGLGGFINVIPGVALVGAELPNSPISIAPATSVLVRKGWMTGLRFIPKFSTPD